MCRRMWRKSAICFLSSAFVVLVGATELLAQGTTGTITGVVTDPSGAVVPNASVTVLNQGTGTDFNLTTNRAGVYSVTSLLPGKYTVTVAARGFKTYVNRDLTLTVNQVLGIDVVLEIGAETQTITVEAAAPLVNTEEGRVSALVSSSEVQNMPLNGRNIYQLMQLAPGAINSTDINLETSNGGSQTNVNGARANFNGFLLDGVANKGLSGGSNSQPSPDFVQEFRIMTNNFSAEYGNSAGSITDVSIKSGTNQLHGSVYEYFRNDKLNARNFFDGDTKQLWRQNQFGATLGGPIKKDKLFFFAGYEGERFRTQSPKLLEVETSAWANMVTTNFPNSTAAYLYSTFPFPGEPTEGFTTIDEMIEGTLLYDIGFETSDLPGGSTRMAYTDPCFLLNGLGIGAEAFSGGPTWGNTQLTANRWASILGVTAAEDAAIQASIAANPACAGLVSPGVQGAFVPSGTAVKGLIRTTAATRTTGVFYNGDQFTVRADYQGDKSRIFGRYIHFQYKDPNATSLDSQFRGFTVPYTQFLPNAAFGYVYNISPTTVNEFRAGYTRNSLTLIPDPSQFGVPQASFDFGEVGFGSYNGYPQFFIENVYSFSDMVAMISGKHSVKLGADYRRNQENSEFNVGRPSYYFFDYLYFANDMPYQLAAGVNPELASGPGNAHLDTNIRAFRNFELGFYVQDDWKVSRNLTLNLGLRWDYYAPHTEKYGTTTNFILPSGGLAEVNCAGQISGACAAPASAVGNTPNGGFVAADQLFAPDKNNFSPRIGFAWDPFGTGKTAIRGGFAVFYETTFWNSLSNSRWNLPFYSFNIAMPIFGYAGLPIYGPTNPDGTPSGAAVTHTGPPDNAGQGPEGLGFAGNIMGWLPTNPNLAYLTGIPDPDGLRNPYMENAFLGFQHEISPSTVVEVNWVGTFGKKLYWAENPNRVVNGRARASVINPCSGEDVAPSPLVNPCFGIMRTWKNSVNSSYNALQVQLNRKMSGGLAFTAAYTWSHWLDHRSTWHSGTSTAAATEYNGWGASGYSLDPNKVFLERGNSSFDIRQRFSTSVVWELPWMRSQQGVAGKILGGWQTNYLLAIQSGFPFTIGARADYNGDGFRNDRPNIPTVGNSYPFRNEDFLAGSGFLDPDSSFMADLFLYESDSITDVTPGQSGNLGRNTFHGPGMATLDFSLFKTFSFSERWQLQFRGEFFNLFNRVNLKPPDARLNSGTFGLSQEAFDPRVIQFGLRLSF